jgi:hypothetical protein
MSKSYKIWIEIEELDENGETKDGGEIGILPDCVGYLTGKDAKRDALARMADIVRAHGIDPEDSDAVRLTEKAKPKPETYSFISLKERDKIGRAYV